MNVADFVVSDGKAEPSRPAPVILTLQQLRDRFKDHAAGKMEDNSLNTVLLHLRHFERTIRAKCANSFFRACAVPASWRWRWHSGQAKHL